MSKSTNSVRSALYRYWDKLQVQGDSSIIQLINAKPNTHYGENQDLISSTCHALMRTYGYVRPETASVYFRQYKNKCRIVKAKAQEAISQVGTNA